MSRGERTNRWSLIRSDRKQLSPLSYSSRECAQTRLDSNLNQEFILTVRRTWHWCASSGMHGEAAPEDLHPHTNRNRTPHPSCGTANNKQNKIRGERIVWHLHKQAALCGCQMGAIWLIRNTALREHEPPQAARHSLPTRRASFRLLSMWWLALIRAAHNLQICVHVRVRISLRCVACVRVCLE